MGMILEGVVFDELATDPVSPTEGMIWYNTTDKQYRCYRNGVTEEFGTNSAKTISYSWTNLKNLHSSTWAVASIFLFEGSNALGVPSSIKVVARQNSTSSDLRVYDVTNSLEIATANFTDTADAIITFGAISNIPAGNAIFELQYKETGTGKIWISSLSVLF